ncbi:ComF family protein [Brevibacillus daliensis]|uniref:ComF family protein n=1 Tax=Brevibacillus daliensis TaxID=2892995 RepID=UPI001E4F34D8|nr:ComF family protein [Brevibacillus daliensis]
MGYQTCLGCRKWLRSGRKTELLVDRLPTYFTSDQYPVCYQLFQSMELCETCIDKLPIISLFSCVQCGRDERVGGTSHCRDCVKREQQVERTTTIHNRSVLRYEEWTKELISQWKYRGDERLTKLCSTLLQIGFIRYYSNERFDCISYVPMHAGRLQERGFNQAEVLAQALSIKLKVPCRPLLERTKETTKQSKQKGRTNRFFSMQDAFQLRVEASQDFSVPRNTWWMRPFTKTRRGMRILLIDDIYTTGATLQACADVLLSSELWGDHEVRSMTLAR